MRKTLVMMLALGMVLAMSSAALADYTTMEIYCKNGSKTDTVAFVYDESVSGEQDPEVLSPGESKTYTDQAAAWFWTVTEYEYTIKVYQPDNEQPICSYWFQMANRWDFADWDFGPKVRYGSSKALIDTKACSYTFTCSEASVNGCEATVTYTGG